MLKNGRRIMAETVTEDGEHVTYQTPAGQISFPNRSSRASSSDDYRLFLRSRVPPSRRFPRRKSNRSAATKMLRRLAVHDNAIDFGYIVAPGIGRALRRPRPIAKVAAAHHAAAQFLLGKGDTDAAIDQYRQALAFAPDNIGLLLNLAVLYLRESQFTHGARSARTRAPRRARFGADVAKLMGWAYYGANKMDLAIEEWKRAEKTASRSRSANRRSKRRSATKPKKKAIARAKPRTSI